MRLNADFSKTAVLLAEDQDWIRSPAYGVDRIMLDRVGDEVARATSIVRYAAGSRFSRHEHAKGEEFLVLEGVFSDEHGDYPTGTYVRNPPGSGHSPFSNDGCRILVKLRQFDPADLTPVAINTNDEQRWQFDETAQISVVRLHNHGIEKVRMLRMAQGSVFSESVGDGGVELFVVNGTVEYDGQSLDAESWLRLPMGSELILTANGATIVWVKSGHLPE
jgi:anti-sigma factor ChrR (cupin superfamily)